MRVAVTRYGPPTRMFGALYAPPARVTARYCVPLGTCTATIVASARGVPSCATTTPLIAAVVTPCPHRGRKPNAVEPKTRSAAPSSGAGWNPRVPHVMAYLSGRRGTRAPELAPDRERRKAARAPIFEPCRI